MKINYCQSCGFPMQKSRGENRDISGTEKDGSKSPLYCNFCYQNGEFIHPGIELKEFLQINKERMAKDQDMRWFEKKIFKLMYTEKHLKTLKRWQEEK